jgi:hypothetical protein
MQERMRRLAANGTINNLVVVCFALLRWRCLLMFVCNGGVRG